ncbi:MAG TPA: prepilin peptidase [Candidatus Paceibacterota bacterium]|nr:prepilin peptidase [Candidatus Paceibacterota bacterium]
MDAYLLCFYGILGLIVGSFLNVLVLRTGSGRSLGGRSFCDTCGMQLAWYHLVPVGSWILQRGRCSRCKARISAQYPAVEALTGIAFAVIGSAILPIAATALALLAAALLIAISVYDLRHTIIPDAWSYLLAAVSLAFAIAIAPPASPEGWLALLVSGPAVALPIYALYALSRGSWMGLGDVKIALSFGWLLGPAWGLAALMGAFVIGAVISVCILLPLPRIARAARALNMPLFGASRGRFTMTSEVPFGPFLACSLSLAWYAHFVLHLPLMVLS